MKTTEEWHLVDPVGNVTVCSTRDIADQTASANTTATTPLPFLLLKKVVVNETLYGVYGSPDTPWPTPPATPIQVDAQDVSRKHIKPLHGQ